MMSTKKVLIVSARIIAACLLLLGVLWLYTTAQIEYNKYRHGVHSTPEEAFLSLLRENPLGVKTFPITSGGPAYRDELPHVWFLLSQGSGMGGGSLFVHTKEGWVHISESSFPRLIGYSMQLFAMTPPEGGQ